MKKPLSLAVLDRLTILSLLPEKGKYEEQIIAKDISNKVQITQEEVTLIGLKSENGRFTWNATLDKAIEVAFTEAERVMLEKSLLALNEKEEIRDAHLNLYKNFVKQS